MTLFLPRRIFQTAIALVFLVLATNTSAQSDWHKEWEKTLAEAKKEGQVNIYIYRYERLLADFRTDPTLDAVIWTAPVGARSRPRIGAARDRMPICSSSTAIA